MKVKSPEKLKAGEINQIACSPENIEHGGHLSFQNLQDKPSLDQKNKIGSSNIHQPRSSSSPVSNTSTVDRKRQFSAKKPAFKARSSRLDSATVQGEENIYRGFFTAFWIAILIYTIGTISKSYRVDGVPIRLRFFWEIMADVNTLFCSDMVMIASCFISVLLHKLVMKRVISISFSLVLQHVWQVLWLSFWIAWVFVRNWRWVQSGFFSLHCVAMLMKQHSYISTNREMERNHRHLEELQELKARSVAEQKKNDQRENYVDVSRLDSEIQHVADDMRTGSTIYPANVSIMNFIDYMLVPTLVYDLEYPRTKKFRIGYFLEKVAGIFATFFLLYMTVEHYVYPVLHDIPNLTFFDSLIDLLFPFMIVYFIIFFIIFEGVCNAFAELTLFADRDFYSDWWNSTNFDEYARKWNRPVHEFLLRHVYFESLETYKLSKNNATFLVFFLSSCLHEMVLAVVGKRLRLYLFGFQMFQIPLIFISRIPFVRRQKLLGNCVYWFSMYWGPPLIATLYVREHFLENTSA